GAPKNQGASENLIFRSPLLLLGCRVVDVASDGEKENRADRFFSEINFYLCGSLFVVVQIVNVQFTVSGGGKD
ncbi:MAG: hypothetical protein RR689_06040, partial [Mucinivorans sp.]